MFDRRHVLIGAAALLAARPARAHRERLTTSRAVWTGEGFDITHDFHRHDAEVALGDAGLIDRPDMSTLRARALLAIHTEETFSLGDGIALDTLGAEVFGNRVEVYQTVMLDALPDRLAVRASMLRDLWPDQINDVDVKIGDKVRSLRFKGGDRAKGLLLT